MRKNLSKSLTLIFQAASENEELKDLEGARKRFMQFVEDYKLRDGIVFILKYH